MCLLKKYTEKNKASPSYLFLKETQPELRCQEAYRKRTKERYKIS